MEDQLKEWRDLGEELADVGPDKFAELLQAMRLIVEAQRTIARFDWQLLFRGRPRKRYLA